MYWLLYLCFSICCCPTCSCMLCYLIISCHFHSCCVFVVLFFPVLFLNWWSFRSCIPAALFSAAISSTAFFSWSSAVRLPLYVLPLVEMIPYHSLLSDKLLLWQLFTSPSSVFSASLSLDVIKLKTLKLKNVTIWKERNIL